ncbi:hypothetical protein DUNSADRAFT_1707 [Dunaliella salina]|uniref:FAD dependent oxidoreductase domain-containing protein n=1 Tax=Dunaliella salina TaxID=3046 RepID=A0ABQ7FX62_DUNSA|nr:hypothetical protein DUNSADRAFT_1707 [Dunaliella salina]|eukprot:KAF5826941.1 hypothetical protein DUNSADRAFT_1707 [Dunaliella salina]
MHAQYVPHARQVHVLAWPFSRGILRGHIIRKSTAAKIASANAKPQVASSASETQPAANILVIGAGVAGLTSALRILQEVPNLKLTVVADKLAALTTSHGAAGLWGPYKLSDTPEDQIMRWSAETHRHLQELYHSPEAAPAGVSICQCHWLHDAPTPPPFWAPIVHQWQPMEERELALFNASWAAQAPPLVQGWAHQSLLCEGRWYLEWLHQVSATVLKLLLVCLNLKYGV